jgi:hypothetical protein
MNMNTIYCYDRMGHIKRLAALGSLAVLASMAAALWDVNAQNASPASTVAQLPMVVVSGHRLEASNLESLPTVVIEGRRSVEPQSEQQVAWAQI